MDMTLWSLETYGYIGNKTKSYQIQRGFLLLFIFLGHPSDYTDGPYTIKSYFVCHQAVRSGRMSLGRIIRS